MNERLNQLLIEAVQVWCQPVSLTQLLGSWRGRGDLSAFADALPEGEAHGQSPNCVVVIEYARLALGNEGDADAADLLRTESQLVLKSHQDTARCKLVHAITHAALAAVEHSAHQPKLACSHLAAAAKLYDRAAQISTQRIAGSDASVAKNWGEDSSIGDPALRLLDLAQRNGSFGSKGITLATWLSLRSLLSHLLGGREPPAVCSNQLQALTLRGDQRGHVLKLGIDKLAWEGTSLASFLDPLSFGITSLDAAMRKSIWLASRCCRQTAKATKDVVLRLSMEDSGMIASLQGPSAGALLGAGMLATMKERKLDASKSTTSQLTLSKAARQRDPLLATEELRPLLAEDLEVRPIRGVVNKLAEAWQAEHGINEFFLHPENVQEWEDAHPGCENPKVTRIQSLATLCDGLWGNRRLDRELERHAHSVHELWNAASDDGQDKEDGLVPVERDHRFECYIPPNFRVEGELKDLTIEAGEESSPETTAERKQNVHERHEAEVPGEGDEQLLRLLELSLRSKTWDEAPDWIGERAGRQLVIYDVAGAGKTVCSYRIAHFLSNSDLSERLLGRREAPLVIRLDGRWRRHVDGRLLSLREVLEQVFSEETNRTSVADYPLVKETIEYAIKNRRVILILDGLDQFQPEERDRVVECFHRDADAKNCRWIITSRVHTIDELRGRKEFFLDRNWTRVRIDPFSHEQQDAYFGKGMSRGKTIGQRWEQTLIDRQAMRELLGLPMVLWMIRILIEEADRKEHPLPVFHSLSQLYLVTSRKLLARALEKNKDEVQARLEKRSDIAIPMFLTPGEELEVIEQVLTLMAFQMLLIKEWNGRLEGTTLIGRFEKLCRNRFLYPLKLKFQAADDFDKDDIRQERAVAVNRWEYALEVLRTIELSHRSVTEAYHEAGIAFRSRKMLECHAARYLTRYATAWDVVSNESADSIPEVDPELESAELPQLCAWDYTTHLDWEETWKLAIDMPQEPISTTDHDGTIENAVLHHVVTCKSLSALFLQPKAYEVRDIRPTELMYRAWHLFEFDDRLIQERQFVIGGKLVLGADLSSEVRKRLGEELLLGARVHSQAAVRQRLKVLENFRDQKSHDLRAEFESRKDRVLVDGQWVKLPANSVERMQLLAKWQQASSLEKSRTLLQCPPQDMIDTFGTKPAAEQRLALNPQVNPAIEGHETAKFAPLHFAATTVTRAMYRMFDPVFEKTQQVSDWPGTPIVNEIQQHASAYDAHLEDDDFPILCTHWYDAWMFCKWLSPKFRLPSEWEWEFACRAGTTTEYHFGNGLNGTQANCDGNHPHGKDESGADMPEGDYEERTTPVGLAKYPCNPWGLFDVHGNVDEWCASVDEGSESSRSLRGGSWRSDAFVCRSSGRCHVAPVDRDGSVGFRLCFE